MAEDHNRPTLDKGPGKPPAARTAPANTTTTTTTSTAMPPPKGNGKGETARGGGLGRAILGGRSGATAARRRLAGWLATLVSLATTLVVAVLAVHIVFVVFEANTANEIVTTLGDRADDLAWQFRDIFQPEDPKLMVGVNYGLAAVIYLIVGRIAVRLIRRLG